MKKLFILLTVIFLSTLYVFSQEEVINPDTLIIKEKFISSDTLITDPKYNVAVSVDEHGDTVYLNDFYSKATEFIKNYDGAGDLLRLVNKHRELYPDSKYESYNIDDCFRYAMLHKDFSDIVNGKTNFDSDVFSINMLGTLTYNIHYMDLISPYSIDTDFLKKFKFNIAYKYTVYNYGYYNYMNTLESNYDETDINKIEACGLAKLVIQQKYYNELFLYVIKNTILYFLSQAYISYIDNYMKNPFAYNDIKYNYTIYLNLSHKMDYADKSNIIRYCIVTVN